MKINFNVFKLWAVNSCQKQCNAYIFHCHLFRHYWIKELYSLQQRKRKVEKERARRKKGCHEKNLKVTNKCICCWGNKFFLYNNIYYLTLSPFLSPPGPPLPDWFWPCCKWKAWPVGYFYILKVKLTFTPKLSYLQKDIYTARNDLLFTSTLSFTHFLWPVLKAKIKTPRLLKLKELWTFYSINNTKTTTTLQFAQNSWSTKLNWP